MSYYNTTNLTNSEDIIGIIDYLQFDVQVMLLEMLLVALFIISFATLKRFNMPNALAGSLVITSLFAMLFWFAGLLPREYATVGIGLLGALIIGIYFHRKGN